MRLLVIASAVLLLALSATPAASARGEAFAPLEPVWDPVSEELRPYCAVLLEDLRAEGIVGNHSAHEELGYEEEWWANAPECAELRDEIEWEYNVYGAVGYVEQCKSGIGATCVAVNHPYCDFVVIVGSGMVFYCIGGLNPEN